MLIQRLAGAARVLALALVLSLPVQAADSVTLPRGVTEVTSVEGITEYTLPNGLRVLLFPDATKPTVTVNITYMVGSRHENYGETGMAHLLEHMLFKGTPTHPDIPGEFRRRGISYNASAWYDRTNYFGSFAAGADNLAWLLALEADRMVNSKVAREDLDSEMTVVRNEMESGETNPFRVLISRMSASAYMWHNYGNTTIGARSDVENMPIERLQAFYRTHYRPDNATLLVAGRIDPSETLKLVNDSFGRIPRPATPIQPTYTREPTQDGEREVAVRRIGDTRMVGLTYHIPAGPHPDSAAIQVLGQVLGDTPSGRLHKALVETNEATGISASPFLLAEPGMFLALAQMPRDGDDVALARRLIDLVENTTATAITQDEVDRARQRLLRGFEQTLNDANRTAMSLSESIAQGDWRLFFLQRDRIEAVTVEDVTRVAQAYFKPANRTLGRFLPTDAPDRAEIPEAQPVAEMLAGYTGREAVGSGETFDPTPANIDARTATAALANGTQLALLPKQTRGNTVNLSMNFRFGSADDVEGRVTAADMAGGMLMRGTANLSREQISRRLDELSARLSVNGGSQGVSVTAQTKREHLADLVDLIAEILTQPAFPESEFEQLRNQVVTGIQSQMSEPQPLASNALGRHFGARWPKGHPYYTATFEETLAEARGVTLADARAFHAEFYGAGFGEIALVGDFDPAEVTAQLERHFGGWTTAKPFERIEAPFVQVEAADIVIETPDKANAVILSRATFPLTDSHPDYAALLIGNSIFGGGGMKSRLGDRVRQTDGLSYSVGSGINIGALDDNAGQSLFAIAAPENIARVKQAFEEERARLLADGVTEEELKDAVDGLLNMRVLGRAEDGNLVGQLRGNLYLGRQMAWSAELEEKIRALTKADVDAALRRHLGQIEFTVVTAGDFAKLEGGTP